MNRSAWLGMIMERKLHRFDNVYAPGYDAGWGAIGRTHASFVSRVVESAPRHGCILDAACGTGRFFPTVLAADRQVVGVDWSEGMLARAAAKFPAVETHTFSLLELPFDGVFDGVICVDALENLPPEDWVAVLASLGRATRRGALVYLTVELPESDEALQAAFDEGRARGWPVVHGEVAVDDGYHYYPARESVRRWLGMAGLDLLDESDDDDYWHLLCQRPSA